MNKDRLLRLAVLLETDAANPRGMKFDIATVGETEVFATSTILQRVLPFLKNPRDLVSCGTSGCAMGLAAISGEFKAEGMTYSVDRLGEEESWTISVVLNGKTVPYDSAAASFFDIDYRDAWRLFSPCYYPFTLEKGAAGELEVARRIRHLVETGSLELDTRNRLIEPEAV